MSKTIEKRIPLKELVGMEELFEKVTIKGREQTRLKSGFVALISTYRLYGVGTGSAPKHIPVIINKDIVNPKMLPFPKEMVVFLEVPVEFVPKVKVSYNLSKMKKADLLNVCSKLGIKATEVDTIVLLKEKIHEHESAAS